MNAVSYMPAVYREILLEGGASQEKCEIVACAVEAGLMSAPREVMVYLSATSGMGRGTAALALRNLLCMEGTLLNAMLPAAAAAMRTLANPENARRFSKVFGDLRHARATSPG